MIFIERPLLPLSAFQDHATLLLRLMTGAFLVDGVWDNIVDAGRMTEFVGFVSAHGFPVPEFSARLSVWIQLFCGIGFLLGFMTRSAALLCTANFIIALIMVHWSEPLRGWWPALALVGIGLMLATHGAGRFSLDAWISARARNG